MFLSFYGRLSPDLGERQLIAITKTSSKMEPSPQETTHFVELSTLVPMYYEFRRGKCNNRDRGALAKCIHPCSFVLTVADFSDDLSKADARELFERVSNQSGVRVMRNSKQYVLKLMGISSDGCS
jgi:hypothetical protein